MSSARFMLSSALAFPRGTPAFTNATLSSAVHKLAIVFSSQESGAITALGTRFAAAVGASPTYQIELQGVDASGFPDGMALIGSSASFNPGALGWTANTFKWISIPGVTLTRGATYALVIRHASGAIDADNNASFSFTQTQVGPEAFTFPYPLTDTGSGYAKGAATGEPVFGYRTSTHTHGNPIQNWNTLALSSDGQRYALKLALNTGLGSTYNVRGLLLHRIGSASNGTLKYGIWDSAGNQIAAYTHDSDHTPASNPHTVKAFFSSVPTLSFGVPYYFGIERVSIANPNPRIIVVSENRDLEAYPLGPGAVFSSWDGSSWTDVNTQLFPVTLLLDAWNIPSAGHVSMVVG